MSENVILHVKLEPTLQPLIVEKFKGNLSHKQSQI